MFNEKLVDIRQKIPETLRKPDSRKTWSILILDVSLYIFGFILACQDYPWNIPGTILTGMVISSLFIWAHDAAHGALMPTRKARLWGKLAMFPSGQIYALWTLGHNRIHHGFTSYTPMDWIWRPWSPEEYRNASRLQRFQYRMERSPWFTAWTYVRRIWFPGMVLFKGLHTDVRRDKLETLAFFVGLSTIAFLMNGFTGIFWAVLVPFLIFQGTIGMVVYLNHTDPETTFQVKKENWNMARAQLHDSVTWRCRPWAEYWLHNILIHTPHHVDTRIPFYYLKPAFATLKASYPNQILERRFTWRRVLSTFKQCQLFDYGKQQWVTFHHLKQEQYPLEHPQS
ncbi:fatty acid desaturase [Acidithiobacillus sp. M4-SHS-6]|uniref:fatty acid desaturase n=1 Tax=Acidithiobacillus sp. M4-SHS-6 TaxID=3383024 RepID=UPI0039BE43D0